MKKKINKIVFRVFVYIFLCEVFFLWCDIANTLNVNLYYDVIKGVELRRDGPVFHPPFNMGLVVVVLLVNEILKMRKMVIAACKDNG